MLDEDSHGVHGPPTICLRFSAEIGEGACASIMTPQLQQAVHHEHPGKDNVMVNTVSRKQVSGTTIDYTALVKPYESDDEIRAHQLPGLCQQLKKIKLPGTDTELCCDISTPVACPYIITPFQ